MQADQTEKNKTDYGKESVNKKRVNKQTERNTSGYGKECVRD